MLEQTTTTRAVREGKIKQTRRGSIFTKRIDSDGSMQAISKETAKLLGQFMNSLDLSKVLVPLRDMMWVQLSQHTLTKLAINNLWSLR